jgi:phage shock protein A
MLTTITAVLSATATLGVGINILVNLRSQRDMAQLENKVLSAINGKYISRKEHEILCKDHEAQMAETKEDVKESRRQHHILHEKFIACRAAKTPEKA